MKKLSRDEMKKIRGGDLNPGDPCTTASQCGTYSCDGPLPPPGIKYWDCPHGFCTYGYTCF